MKIWIKLVSPGNVVKTDDGKVIPPYENIEVEETARVKDLIRMNLVQKVGEVPVKSRTDLKPEEKK
jgi:hypothetical protein